MSTTARTVAELAAHVGGRVVGDGGIVIERVASLESADTDEITYVEDEKFFAAASQTKASCVITPENAELNARCRIEVSKPKLAFALIAEVLHPPKRNEPSIHSTAVVAETADIALTAFVGPH